MQDARSRPSRATAIRCALLAILALCATFAVVAHAATDPPAPVKAPEQVKHQTQAQREAAARRNARQGMTSAETLLAQAKAGVETAAAATDPTPHFHGPPTTSQPCSGRPSGPAARRPARPRSPARRRDRRRRCWAPAVPANSVIAGVSQPRRWHVDGKPT